MIERAYAMGAREQIGLGDVSIIGRPTSIIPVATSTKPIPTLAEVEKDLILKALSLFKNDKETAARALGLSRRTIYRRLKEYGML
jgi:DNA-binding NtrC family response regulator